MALSRRCSAREERWLRFRWTLAILLAKVLKVSAKFPATKKPLSLVTAQMPLEKMSVAGSLLGVEVADLSEEARSRIQAILGGEISNVQSTLSPMAPLTLPRAVFRGTFIPYQARKFAWSNPMEAEGVDQNLITKLVYHDSPDHQVSFLARGGLVFFDNEEKICGTSAFKDAPPVPDPLFGIWYAKPYLARELEDTIDKDRWQHVVDHELYPGATQRVWLMPGEGGNQFGGDMFRFEDSPALVFPFLSEEPSRFPAQLTGGDLVDAELDTSIMKFHVSGNSDSLGVVSTDSQDFEPSVKAVLSHQRAYVPVLSQAMSPLDNVLRTSTGMSVSTYYMMLPEFRKRHRNDFLVYKHRTDMEYMSYVHPAQTEPPLMPPPQAMNLQINNHPMKQQLFLSEGGFVFMGREEESGERIKKAYVLVWNSHGHIQFGQPFEFKDVPGIEKIQAERYQWVQVPIFRAAGARKYTWVTAADQIKSSVRVEGSWFNNINMGNYLQGFAFQFDDEKKNVFFPVVHQLGMITWAFIIGIGILVLLIFLGLVFCIHRWMLERRARLERWKAEEKRVELLGENPSQAELMKRRSIASSRKSLISLQQLEVLASTPGAPLAD